MSVVEAVGVVLVFLLAAAVLFPRPPEDAHDATVGATFGFGGNQLRCTTRGHTAVILAVVVVGVAAVLLLTR
jgi:hypothetical protein